MLSLRCCHALTTLPVTSLYSRANSVDQFIEHLSGHPQEVEEGLLVFPSKLCRQSVVVAIPQSSFSL